LFEIWWWRHYIFGQQRMSIFYSVIWFSQPAPICKNCQVPLTVKQILLECNDLQERRTFQSRTLHHLFTNYPINDILQFLHDTNYESIL
jgi:hypothetical protein